MFKQVGHAAVFPQISAVLAEGQPQIRRGAVAVVRERFHQHRHAAGAVALVAHLLELGSITRLT